MLKGHLCLHQHKKLSHSKFSNSKLLPKTLLPLDNPPRAPMEPNLWTLHWTNHWTMHQLLSPAASGRTVLDQDASFPIHQVGSNLIGLTNPRLGIRTAAQRSTRLDLLRLDHRLLVNLEFIVLGTDASSPIHQRDRNPRLRVPSLRLRNVLLDSHRSVTRMTWNVLSLLPLNFDSLRVSTIPIMKHQSRKFIPLLDPHGSFSLH